MAPFSRRACTAVAALLLSVAVILLHGHPAAAQQSTPPPALAAPELTAQAADGTIELTWTQVPGAARYELWTWWDEETGWQQLGGDDLTTAAYTHTGLNPGTTYYYQIRAVAAGSVTSEWSQRLSVSLPGSLAAPALTPQAAAGAVNLTWEPVPGAARYELWTWWNEDPGWQQLSGDNLTATSFSHTGLTAGVTYYYQMRAVNAGGVASPWSQQVSAAATQVQPLNFTPTPAPETAPASTLTPTASSTPNTVPVPSATPTATPLLPLSTHSLLVSGDSPPLLVARATDGAVELTWDPVTGAAYYDLRSWTEAGGWQHLGGENLTGAIFHHTALTAGTDYYYWISAVDEMGGMGPWSERVSAKLTAEQASAPAPSPTPTVSTTPTTTPSPTPTASPTKENLEENTATPTSTQTPSLPTPTPTSTPTPTPTQLAASSEFTPPVLTASASVGAVELRWGAVAGAVRYILQSWTSAGGYRQLGGDNLTDTSYIHSGLTVGVTYYYWVRAVNASADMTPWSARLDVPIPSALPPAIDANANPDRNSKRDAGPDTNRNADANCFADRDNHRDADDNSHPLADANAAVRPRLWLRPK